MIAEEILQNILKVFLQRKMKEAKNANLEREIFSGEIASFMLKYNKHFFSKMLILFILNISQSFATITVVYKIYTFFFTPFILYSRISSWFYEAFFESYWFTGLLFHCCCCCCYCSGWFLWNWHFYHPAGKPLPLVSQLLYYGLVFTSISKDVRFRHPVHSRLLSANCVQQFNSR